MMRHAMLTASLAALVLAPGAARAGLTAEQKPAELAGVELKEKLGATVPKDLKFTDDQGRPATIGQYVTGTKPVILTFNYMSCPMLCSLQLKGLVNGMKQLEWTAGEDFTIVTVDINHRETWQEARARKEVYVDYYQRPAALEGWHFLTGDEATIRAMAQSVGVSFKYDEETGEYLHPAAAILLSPGGMVVRTLAGLEHEPKTLKLALIEAGQGTIGSPLDQLVLNCFRYNSAEHRYALTAVWIMRGGGMLTILLLGGYIGLHVWRESRGRKSTRVQAPTLS